MENIVYKRDYKEVKAARDKQNLNDIPSQVFDYLITSDALATMNDAYTEMPRAINDGHKAAYERILNSLDRIANTFGGQIEGVVDYQNWEASIFVVHPFVEFSSVDELALLKDIASNSQTVTFTVMPEGKVRMKMLIDYFDIVGNVDTMLEEEILNNPKLVAMLEEADRSEKRRLMTNPQIAIMVRLGAESMGISEEEYLDKIVKFLRNPPEGFMEKIQQWVDAHSG